MIFSQRLGWQKKFVRWCMDAKTKHGFGLEPSLHNAIIWLITTKEGNGLVALLQKEIAVREKKLQVEPKASSHCSEELVDGEAFDYLWK